MDALDHRAFQRFGKKQKAEFAKRKQEQETRAVMLDTDKVKKMSAAFRQKIAEDRRRLGL